MNKQNIGWINGLVGVLIFSGSLPATKIAVVSMHPEFLTASRAVIAALAGLLCLILCRQLDLKKINLDVFKSLSIVAVGVVIGFPLFTALALEHIPSSRAIVFVGLLPCCTALFGVFRNAERPSLMFWCFSILGACMVVGFMKLNDDSHRIGLGDLYMLIAMLLCGLGYAEGSRIAQTLGSWQVICWALIVAFPMMFLIMIYEWPEDFGHLQSSSIWALLYVSLFSMLIGFFFWYKGLSLGGVAKVGQIQLIQPFFGLILSAVLLGEHISMVMIMTACAVCSCVVLAKRYG